MKIIYNILKVLSSENEIKVSRIQVFAASENFRAAISVEMCLL